MTITEGSDFLKLANSIQIIDQLFKDETAKAVNRNLTARNWLIGYYLFNYEQMGNDRAQYGSRVLQTLAKELKISSLSYGNLKLYRQFYQEFPLLSGPIRNYIANKKDIIESLPHPIGQTLLGQFVNEDAPDASQGIGQTLLGQLYPETIFSKIPYSHLTLLFPIKDDVKRTFYEIECIKGTWSFRELKRQIDTNYYERTALSNSPHIMSTHVQKQAERISLSDVVKSPHVYEFLGLKERDVVEETDLEQAIMNHLQEYLLELGQGFCFEARQIMLSDDNPPVGILLCTEMGNEQVEYATAGMDQQLFISKYLLELPPKKELAQWLNNAIKEIDLKHNN